MRAQGVVSALGSRRATMVRGANNAGCRQPPPADAGRRFGVRGLVDSRPPSRERGQDDVNVLKLAFVLSVF
eukprot:5354155-Lingulodinium_polyedra.AAC.1